jgi:O-antigen ligase
VNEAEIRRPGGLARLLALLATAVGFFAVFSIGFPPASRERLPVLALAGLLALVAAWDRAAGLAVFAVLVPLAGLGGRLAGGVDAIAWPILLFLGVAAGWTFRFLYDFESAPDPSRADRVLRALVALWSMAAALAVVRARTLWAAFRGLRLRAVNVEGLPDSDAIRGTLLSFAVLAAAAAFYFLLRRAGRADRERTLAAGLAGIAVSAAIAIAGRLGVLATETSPFWKATGRLSGGAVDPNALGILCALGAVVAAAVAAGSRGRRRLAAGLALALMAGGLVLSGSRSGLALAAIGLAGLLFARGIRPGARGAAVLAAVLLVAAVAVPKWSGTRASAGARVVEIFDGGVPIEFRVSGRPVLWESAVRLFGRHPVEGAGLGAFTWQLPNLLAEEGRTLGASDNPGNAYLQALAETGAIGFALTLAFTLLLAREAWAALRDPEGPAVRAGAGAAILGFLAALATGSHWFAPDAALFFFLLAAAVGRPAETAARPRPGRAGRLALGAYAAAALWAASSTMDEDEAFRYRREIGFYAPETGPGGAFRWTQRRFAIRLAPRDSMRLVLAHYTPEGRSVALAVEADGAPLLTRTLEPGEAVALRLAAPPARARVFRFALSRSFVPRRLGPSTDRRELGVVAVFGGVP